MRIFCRFGPTAYCSPFLSPLLLSSSPLLVLVPRQRSEGILSLPSPLSTAERGHGEPMSNVFDRHPPPSAHPRHEAYTNRPNIVEGPLARWGHLAAPSFFLCNLESPAACHTHSTVNGSTSRLFDARRCPLRARVLSASIYLREHSHKHAAQLYHQPGSQRRQGPRKRANSALNSAGPIRPAISWAGPGAWDFKVVI